MNKKNCDLCMKNRAKMYCESDEANLCWDCDSKVHCANFLVAKHTRNLLCHSCQNPTPWSSTGPKLSPTLSVCNSCLENPAIAAAAAERVEENNYQTETDDDEEDDEYVSSDSEIDDDDDDGNQVVPLSSSSTFSSPEGSVSCSDSYGGLLRAGDGGGGATAELRRR